MNRLFFTKLAKSIDTIVLTKFCVLSTTESRAEVLPFINIYLNHPYQLKHKISRDVQGLH